MKRLVLIFFFLPGLCSGQTAKIDSLKARLHFVGTMPNGVGKDTTRSRTLTAIVKAYFDVDIDSASAYNKQLIALCERAKLKKDLIYAFQYAGYLYQVKGDFHQSIRYHYKALPLAEELKQYRRMAASYGWLAHAYTSLREFRKATVLCKKGLLVLRSHPDSYIQSSILNVQGAIYRQQGKLQQALQVNQLLYAVAKAGGHSWYEAQGLHAIGWVYKEMNEAPRALEYFNQALTLARKVGSVDLQGSILLNISKLHYSQGAWKNAFTYCNTVIGLAQNVKNSSLESEAFEQLYKIFKKTNRPLKALIAYENFVALRDSLSKEKTDHRIETLQAQYDNIQKSNELHKKQLEVLAHQRARNALYFAIAGVLLVAALLFWNNSRLQSANGLINGQKELLEMARKELADTNKRLESRVQERTRELVDANRELTIKNEEIKKALFKGQTIERKRVAIELHDNLSGLLSAVNMSIQHINLQYLPEPEQSVYQNIRHLIQSAYAEVRNISHNILPAELEKEGLICTLSSLVGKLNQNSPLQFSLTMAGFDQRLPVEIEFNAYSIVLELINNAIKHAKANAVTISLNRTEYGIDLIVTDDGVGIGNAHDKRGVGLQNIQSRLESLGGTFEAIRPQEQGTRITIKIPVEMEFVNGN